MCPALSRAMKSENHLEYTGYHQQPYQKYN
ncbi:hypothetical protein M942_09605 [Enterobacter ludwigii]|nr:hypothetical protein M942_09605 [Enterobacter ludwigii]